jgi:DNA polymerase-4
VTRSATLSETTNLTKVLWEAAERLFNRWHARAGGPLRLLGFAASGLAPERAGQQSLFSDPEQEKLRRLDKTVDKIRDRYGRGAVHRGNRQNRPDRSP